MLGIDLKLVGIIWCCDLRTLYGQIRKWPNLTLKRQNAIRDHKQQAKEDIKPRPQLCNLWARCSLSCFLAHKVLTTRLGLGIDTYNSSNISFFSYAFC